MIEELQVLVELFVYDEKNWRMMEANLEFYGGDLVDLGKVKKVGPFT